jgi:hypothetical protein
MVDQYVSNDELRSFQGNHNSQERLPLYPIKCILGRISVESYVSIFYEALSAYEKYVFEIRYLLLDYVLPYLYSKVRLKDKKAMLDMIKLDSRWSFDKRRLLNLLKKN